MNEQSPKSETDDKPASMRRSTRYMKAQQRRAAQRASDNRFYGSMFALIGIVVMATLLIAAVAMNGGGMDVSGLGSWTTPWLGPFTKLEIAGLVLVGVIAVFMYRRIKKR